MHTLSRGVFLLSVCLSALAGCVDALGFLQLGGYFISFMSGNSTMLAVNLVSGNLAGIGWLASIIALFVGGTILGVWVRHFSKEGAEVTSVLAFVTLLLTGAAVSHEAGQGFLAIVFMAMAMGAENAVLQRNGDVVVGLTYMTGALVKMGQRMAQATLGGAKFAWVPYLMLWLGLLCGGATGSLLFHFFGMHGLWFAVLWAGGLTGLSAWFKGHLHA